MRLLMSTPGYKKPASTPNYQLPTYQVGGLRDHCERQPLDERADRGSGEQSVCLLSSCSRSPAQRVSQSRQKAALAMIIWALGLAIGPVAALLDRRTGGREQF